MEELNWQDEAAMYYLKVTHGCGLWMPPIITCGANIEPKKITTKQETQKKLSKKKQKNDVLSQGDSRMWIVDPPIITCGANIEPKKITTKQETQKN